MLKLQLLVIKQQNNLIQTKHLKDSDYDFLYCYYYLDNNPQKYHSSNILNVAEYLKISEKFSLIWSLFLVFSFHLLVQKADL